MHLTLRFAGDLSAREADEFAAALDDVRAAPFSFRIRGAGAFGGGAPNVLYAAIEPNPSLDALQRQNDRAARTAGLSPDPRPFRPHITLARLRHGRPAPVARFLEECGDLSFDPIPVTRFVLMSARPGNGGGPYAVEEVYDFVRHAVSP
jgi:2'-5' RNA ligase